MTDHELLAEHVSGTSSEAFTELVRRHLPLVLSTARRRLTAPDQADDVAQQVFTLLARKARMLPPDVILAGWLYRTTCLVAGDQNRSDHRRRQRELHSVTVMNDPQPEPEGTWREIQPLLDEAMTCLTERDRDAVVLRFFEGRSLKDVGDALGISPDAAQKRLSRSLDRLRESLARKQRLVTPAALAAAITAGAIQVTPTSAQAASIAATALSAASSGLSVGTTSLIAMSTLKTLTVGVIGAALVTALVLQQRKLHEVQTERDRAVAATETVETSTPAAQSPSTGVDPELLRLRGEVARLRSLSNDVVRLTREMNTLRAARAADAARRPEVDSEEQKRLGIAKMTYLKGWAVGAFLYAESHGGMLPKSFEEIASLVPKESQSAEFNPDHFEFTYQGRLDTLGEPNKYIIAREKDGMAMRTDRGYMRAYAFGDGHSELHFSADGNFEQWEAEHTPPAGGTPPAKGVF
jgi:RNA polymerase sigma factor (sigma-70 family)